MWRVLRHKRQQSDSTMSSWIRPLWHVGQKCHEFSTVQTRGALGEVERGPQLRMWRPADVQLSRWRETVGSVCGKAATARRTVEPRTTKVVMASIFGRYSVSSSVPEARRCLRVCRELASCDPAFCVLHVGSCDSEHWKCFDRSMTLAARGRRMDSQNSNAKSVKMARFYASLLCMARRCFIYWRVQQLWSECQDAWSHSVTAITP